MKTLIHLKLYHVAIALAVILSMSPDRSGAQYTANRFGLSSKDEAFIKEAGERQLAGKEMGDVGKKKATNPVVYSLAGTLLKDHTQDSEELWRIAASKGVTYPPSPGIIQKIRIDSLHARSGGERFDKIFVEDVVTEQKNDLAYYEKASKELSDLDLKAFAARTVPIIKKDLEMAENAAASIP